MRICRGFIEEIGFIIIEEIGYWEVIIGSGKWEGTPDEN